MNKDITGNLLKGCSPYIGKMVYDVADRTLIIECVDNVKNMRPAKRIELSGVVKYDEENLDDVLDDQLLDSIIGINWMDDKKLCIHTEKKEIILKLENSPRVIDIKAH